jgi:hypothetical protein
MRVIALPPIWDLVKRSNKKAEQQKIEIKRYVKLKIKDVLHQSSKIKDQILKHVLW